MSDLSPDAQAAMEKARHDLMATQLSDPTSALAEPLHFFRAGMGYQREQQGEPADIEINEQAIDRLRKKDERITELERGLVELVRLRDEKATREADSGFKGANRAYREEKDAAWSVARSLVASVESPTPQEARCGCGHTAHWHGAVVYEGVTVDPTRVAQGAGVCGHHAEDGSPCGCEGFEVAAGQPREDDEPALTEAERANVEEVEATMREEALGYEYRLSWECPSAACVMAHQGAAWESLSDEEWDALPWEKSWRVADGGDVHSQRHTLEQWAEDHLQPVRNVRFERRLRPSQDDGWNEVAERGATGVTHWKARPAAALPIEGGVRTDIELSPAQQQALEVAYETHTGYLWGTQLGAQSAFRAAFKAGVAAVPVEHEVTPPSYDPQAAMMAVLRAYKCVREGRWVKGAATHVFAELLTELEKDGWWLTRGEHDVTDAEVELLHEALVGARDVLAEIEGWITTAPVDYKQVIKRIVARELEKLRAALAAARGTSTDQPSEEVERLRECANCGHPRASHKSRTNCIHSAGPQGVDICGCGFFEVATDQGSDDDRTSNS